MNDALLLIAGLVMIIKGGDFFVVAAVRIAEFLRMPRVVIGSTLVSLTTTTPELMVSIMASVRGEPGLAVGNAVGSVICNIALILGITATIKHVDIHLHSLRRPLLVMLSAGALLFLMTFDLDLSRGQGALLLACGAAYFVWDFVSHWRDRKPADRAEAKAIEAGLTKTRFTWIETKPGSAVQFLVGATIVVLGSHFLVDGAVGLAHRMGIPSILVGLTVVAVGTSLPELITAITSSRKSVSDLAVGNVLGANIANLTFIVGTAALLQEVTVTRPMQLYNGIAMLVVMAALMWMLWTDRRVSRREGVVLLTMYGIYVAALIALTLRVRR